MFGTIEKKKKSSVNLESAGRAALLLCMLLLPAGCGENGMQQFEPAEVLYTIVAEERITLTNELPGRVSALVTAEVRPQVEGIIQERLFEEGSDVVKGQVLYIIDPSLYQAAYNTAQAALEEAEANVVALERLETRYKGLLRTNAVSRQDHDNAVADHGQARARIARAKADLEAAAINLAYTQIKAPVSGRIGRSSVTAGALVTANQPEALAVIQQTGRVYVDITQSSTDLLRMRRSLAQGRLAANGSAAKVRLMLEDGTPYTLVAEAWKKEPGWILGDLLFSEISVSQTTGAVTLRAVFENPEGMLLPGMYVKAIIEEGAIDNAVLVPQGSVGSDGSGGHYVLVVKKGLPPGMEESGNSADDEAHHVSRREVELDRARGNRWLIKSGLEAGEMLVVEGMQKAVPDQPVKAIPALEPSSSLATRQTVSILR